MAYIAGNPKTKKQLKEMLADPNIEVFVFSNSLHGGDVPTDGRVYLEGPHYPEPHKWYAQGQMRDGKLVSIK